MPAPAAPELPAVLRVRISKALCKILRHETGLVPDAAGFLPIHSLSLQLLRDDRRGPKRRRMFERHAKTTDVEALVRQVMTSCPKGRFQFSEDGLSARATQGHSLAHIDDDKLLTRVEGADEVPTAIHGTYTANLDSIRERGLCSGARNHIHMTADRSVYDVRPSCNALLHIDVKAAMDTGVLFFRACNGVILARGIIPWSCIPHVTLLDPRP